MSAKDQLRLFAEMCFTILIITLAIKIFTVEDRILVLANLLKGISPVIILFGALFMKLRYSQYQEKRFQMETGRTDAEYVLVLNFYHKMIGDLILFIVPIAILSIALLSKAELAKEDIIQASVAFVLFYYWQQMIFSKRER